MSLNKDLPSKKLVIKKYRRIKTTQNTDRGIFFTDKNPDGFVEFESLSEEGLYSLLDHDPNCISIESQPFKIPNSKGKNYIPDTFARFRDGTEVVFDVKHSLFFQKMQKNKEKARYWNSRTERINKFCERYNMHYIVVTNKEIFNERLENIQFFRKNFKEPENVAAIKKEVEIILSNETIPRYHLAQKISNQQQKDIREIIPIIDHLIYQNFFNIDWNTKITDETILYLQNEEEDQIKPIYQYLDEKIHQKGNPIRYFKIQFNNDDFTKKDSRYPEGNALNQREFLALSEKIQNLVLERIEMLQIFDMEDYSTEKLESYAKNHEIHPTTLYRWKKAFDKSGWVGLIPEYKKRGKKKGKNKQLEALIQQVIKNRYLTDIQPSIAGCYRFLKIQCKKHGIKPCSQETFRLRVKEISPEHKTLKRRGRKVHRDTYKPLKGIYPFGTHPLDAVEFDHTILDIMLVDRVHREPVGRPTITIAIDVYTRMVYGYYLSFDPPSHLSVGMCFLNGIMPKDKILLHYDAKSNWPIYGIPKRVILDNAKEFRGHAFQNFCKQYNIEMIFNPVHKPEKKPHVERLIKTINMAIRDDLIKGYIVPLKEKRKTQYDPEKKAHLTIKEFEKWLVQWFVDDYHQRVHSGIEKKRGIEASPLILFEQGLMDSQDRIVGLPTFPKTVDQLKFDVLAFKRRKLSRNGIRLFGLEYYSPIIPQLRDEPNFEDNKWIVRYDPRDIREIYLWVEPYQRYEIIPLKDAFFENLQIESSPTDVLSKKELAIIKRLRKEEFTLRSPKIQSYDLEEAINRRQEILSESLKKKKTAKRARKRKEKIISHSKKATSTQIRQQKTNARTENTKPFTQKPPNHITADEESEISYLDAFPIKTNWDMEEFVEEIEDDDIDE